MKYFIAFALLLVVGLLSGQTKIDTTSHDNGNIYTIKYSTYKYTGELSKSDLFMRNMVSDNNHPLLWRIDSVKVFGAGGHYLRTRIRGSYKPRDPSLPADDEWFVNRNKLVEGYSGNTVRDTLNVRNPKSKTQHLNLKDKKNGISISGPSFYLNPGQVGKLALLIDIPSGVHTKTFNLTDSEGEVVEFSLTLHGYDLTETDFVSLYDLSEKEKLVLNKRTTLYLRLRSTEKLLNLYREGKLYRRIPIGRQLDEIDLSQLSPGSYMLQIVDLATGDKRYHGIEK